MSEYEVVVETADGILCKAPPADVICPDCFRESATFVGICNSVVAYCAHSQRGALLWLVHGATWRLYAPMPVEIFLKDIAAGVDVAKRMRLTEPRSRPTDDLLN